MFENHQKCLIWIFEFWLCPIKSDLSGNTVWPQALSFQNATFSVIFKHRESVLYVFMALKRTFAIQIFFREKN